MDYTRLASAPKPVDKCFKQDFPAKTHVIHSAIQMPRMSIGLGRLMTKLVAPTPLYPRNANFLVQ